MRTRERICAVRLFAHLSSSVSTMYRQFCVCVNRFEYSALTYGMDLYLGPAQITTVILGSYWMDVFVIVDF